SVVSAYLRRAGVESRTAPGARAAERMWQEWRPDLVVLDVMLPGFSGLELLRRMRGNGDRTLVVVLSARGEVEDRVVGLETGADDYLVKPFSPRELMLRITGLLRREESAGAGPVLPPVLRVGPVTVDTAAHLVHVRGRR